MSQTFITKKALYLRPKQFISEAPSSAPSRQRTRLEDSPYTTSLLWIRLLRFQNLSCMESCNRSPPSARLQGVQLPLVELVCLGAQWGDLGHPAEIVESGGSKL